MIRMPRHSWIWLATLLCWLAFLWFLSSRPGSGKIYPVDHIDKVLHFSYFCVGGFLCAGWLYRRNPLAAPNWHRIANISVILLTLVGGLDEWHQTQTPFRTGNDAGDLFADFAGALVGAYLFRSLQRKLRFEP